MDQLNLQFQENGVLVDLLQGKFMFILFYFFGEPCNSLKCIFGKYLETKSKASN